MREFLQGPKAKRSIRGIFNNKISRVTKKPLELVHSDVCGPIIESIGGSRYFITFTDDYSRYVVAYTMKHKYEAFDKFKEYVAMAETKFERKMKKVRTDNGGEYVSEVFNNYLKECGTQDKRTVPWTPEQNGIAKRMNRTLPLQNTSSFLGGSIDDGNPRQELQSDMCARGNTLRTMERGETERFKFPCVRVYSICTYN